MYSKYFKYFSSKEASEAVEEDELHEAGFWGDQQRDHRWRVAGDKTDLTIYQNKTKLNRSHYLSKQNKTKKEYKNTTTRKTDLTIYQTDKQRDHRSQGRRSRYLSFWSFRWR